MQYSENKKIKVLLVSSPKTDLGFNRAVKTICEATVLDLVAAGRNHLKYLQKILSSYHPDVVGIGCMSFQYAEAISLAHAVKSFNKRCLVVLGGYHPTVESDSILSDTQASSVVDFLIRGEGEAAFNSFIKTLSAGGSFSSVPNLSFIDHGKIVHTANAGLVDLDTIKIPDRDARILTKGFYLFGNRADVIETSRGCTSRCDFCSIRQMYGPTFRKYGIERIIEDITDAKNHGAKAIFIADDNIALDGNRYKELCQAIIAAKLSMNFFIQASVRGLHRTSGLIDLMVQSGVRWVFLGIENVAVENRIFLDKNDQFKNEDVFQVVSALREKKVLVIGGFIIGNPDDTEETIRANYEYAKRLKIDVALFFILTPFPKTEIREKLFEQGLITNLDDYSQYTCFKACIKTKHLSSEQLFALREEMGYRYPIDSGSIWRLAREFLSHPIHYLFHLGIGQLIQNPKDVVSYLKGFSRKR
jgi:radical SAM superfamily enzyme YgiQ (UPF0313 family)